MTRSPAGRRPRTAAGATALAAVLLVGAGVLGGCTDDEPAAGGPSAAPAGVPTAEGGDGLVWPEPAVVAPSDRRALVGAVPVELTRRGVYVLDPTSDSYPGSPFDPLLPTDRATLLVEATAGPVGLLAGTPADVEVAEPALRVDLPDAGSTVVLAPAAQLPAVQQRLPRPAPATSLLAQLAATTAPFAWAGRVADGVEAIVTLDGDRLDARLRSGGDAEDLAEQVRTALAGSLPGSPGKPWDSVLADVDVRVEAGAVRVQARATALPPELLRTLLDRTSPQD